MQPILWNSLVVVLVPSKYTRTFPCTVYLLEPGFTQNIYFEPESQQNFPAPFLSVSCIAYWKIRVNKVFDKYCKHTLEDTLGGHPRWTPQRSPPKMISKVSSRVSSDGVLRRSPPRCPSMCPPRCPPGVLQGGHPPHFMYLTKTLFTRKRRQKIVQGSIHFRKE
jgi:hypothetical protein